MSKVVRGLVGIVLIFALLVAALLVAPWFLPAEKIKQKLAQETSASLGRPVTLDGPLSIRLFPTARLDVQDMVIANTAERQSPPLLSVSEAHVGVNVLALLRGTVEITQFVLIEPKIFLEGHDTPKAPGDNAMSSASMPSAPPPSAAPTDTLPPPLPVRNIALGDVTIKNGHITYYSHADSSSVTAQSVNLRAHLKSLDTPLLLAGDLTIQDKPATLQVEISTPKALLEQQPGKITVNLSVAENAVRAVINLVRGHKEYTGDVQINAPTLRDISAIFGVPLSAQTGIKSLDIGGTISGTPTTLAFTDAAVKLDQISGTGSLRVDWGGQRPNIMTKMDFDRLDLRPYLPAATSKSADTQKEKITFPPWSEETIDLSILKMVDVTLAGTTQSLRLHDIKIDKSALSVVLEDGKLTAKLTDLQLYGGKGAGQFVLDAKNSIPNIRLDFDLTALDTKVFATDFLHFSQFSGTGNLSFALAAHGKSQAALIANLYGEGRFDIIDGTITGVDFQRLGGGLADLVAGFQETGKVQSGVLLHTLATAQGEDAQTPFSTCRVSFDAAMGVITSNDITIEAPYIALHGQGAVDLPAQNIDMMLLPTIQNATDASIDGPVSAPIHIKGHFNDIKISVDTKSILKTGIEKKARKLLEDNGIDTSDKEDLKEVVKEKLFQKLFGD